MGEPAVSESGDTGSWDFAASIAPDIQGLLTSPFKHLEKADALFLRFGEQHGGAWLTELRGAVPITDAAGKTTPCAAIAFTATGLMALGLGDDVMIYFSPPFRDGMHQIDRARRLGDRVEDGMAIEGGPIWSGNALDPLAEIDEVRAAAETPITVHAALLMYDKDDAAVDKLSAKVRPILAAHGVEIVRQKRLSLRFDELGRAREHFGFVDGVSQPVPYDPRGAAIVGASGAPFPQDPWHGVPAGDIVMGYQNAHAELAPGPLVAMEPTQRSMLPVQDAPEGFRNLGLNGSYLVIRELRQDVPAFWKSMDKAAQAVGRPEADSDWVAARVIGRDKDGAPLCPAGVISPGPDGTPANDFGYFSKDAAGTGCPVGSHMRRSNPRDGLAPTDADRATLLQAANNHRILRRGRKFGPDIADRRTPDGEDRGLLFMCLNTDLVRQFEFVQQTWLLNQSFGTLLDETDPLVGPRGKFTIPLDPLRVRVPVETFIKFAGGEYFFLPSLPALDYLATLPQAKPSA